MPNQIPNCKLFRICIRSNSGALFRATNLTTSLRNYIADICGATHGGYPQAMSCARRDVAYHEGSRRGIRRGKAVN